MPTDPEASTNPLRGRHLLTLSLASLGVVYGDIGTSPLYAIRACFHAESSPHQRIHVFSRHLA